MARPFTELRPTLIKADDPVPEGHLNVRDIEGRYRVNDDTARRWFRQGRLPSIKIGSAYYIPLASLLAFEARELAG